MISASIYNSNMTGRGGQIKYDYWTPENPTNEGPGPFLIADRDGVRYGHLMSYFNGSYFKMRTITLGYSFNRNMLQKINVSRARLYVTAQNPFVILSPFKKYSGMDPEPNGRANTGTRAQGNQTLQVGGTNPATRSFILGLNLTF